MQIVYVHQPNQTSSISMQQDLNLDKKQSVAQYKAPSSQKKQIDLLIPSMHHRCSICKVLLLRYTRIVAEVNSMQNCGNAKLYKNYCVQCFAKSAKQLAHPSNSLNYFVCKRNSFSNEQNMNWTIAQTTALFCCIQKYGLSDMQQIQVQFHSLTGKNRHFRQLEFLYNYYYQKYFKNTDMDSRLSQPIISQPAKPDNKQQHITGSWKNSYPPADQAFVQQFCSLLNLNNSTDHYKNVRQNLPNFLLFSIINNKETRDIFQSKKFIQQNITRDRMVNFVIKQMQNRQIWNEDVNMTNKMICDIYIYMKKRSNRSTRQKLQVKKNEHQFNLEHPELRKLGTIKKAKDIFNFVAQLKHKREDILKQQRFNGKKNDQIPKTNIITENKRKSLRKIKKATTVDAVNSRKNLISKETKGSPQKVQITLRSGKQIKSNNIIDF